jgi:molecular chaperone GrpE (heat shock protein)
MEDSIKMADEFASAMQQLSAEAQKSIPEVDVGSESQSDIPGQLALMAQEFRALNVRVQNVESKMMQRLEQITQTFPIDEGSSFVNRFSKLDEQLDAIRNNEGMNQRLFDCLHDELIKYRDNFLHESLQKPFIRDLMVLFDDLNSIATQLKTVSKSEAKRTTVAQARENLENAIHALVEILHRLEVNEIEAKDTVDLTIHRVVSFEPTEIAEEDGRIVMRLKRGFFWRDRVLRPEEVIAKRFN